MSNSNFSSDIQILEDIKKKLEDTSKQTEDELQKINKEIHTYKKTLHTNNILFSKYSDDIKNKMQLLATRDRMLQISQERNIYKRKIIYILLSMIVALLVSIVCGFTFFSKLKKM